MDPTRIDIRFDPRVQRMEGIAAHGHTPFSVPYISEIDDNLWQGGCQDGLILPDFIKHVVSLYVWEQYEVKHDFQSYMLVRAYDGHEVLPAAQLYALADWINTARADAPVLVHCQAGLNRSSLLAGLALIRAGKSPEDAIAQIRERRSPACLCNKTFEQWLLDQA